MENPEKLLAENEDRLRDDISKGYENEKLLEALRPILDKINNNLLNEFKNAGSDQEALIARRRWEAMQYLVDELATAVQTATMAKDELTRLRQAAEWAKKQARRLRA